MIYIVYHHLISLKLSFIHQLQYHHYRDYYINSCIYEHVNNYMAALYIYIVYIVDQFPLQY